MSERHITHIVPEDGTQHEPVECYCHPEVQEANATGALLGLEDVGVSPSEAGALIFAHNAAGPHSVTTIFVEGDDEDEGGAA